MVRRIGVDWRTIRGWETGAFPRAEYLARLAEVLGLDCLDLASELAEWRGQH